MSPTSYYVIILIVLLLIVIILCITTNMLRNVVFDQNSFNAIATANNLKNPKPGFSLSSTQFAFWTVIIIGSFIYVAFFYNSAFQLNVPKTIDSVNLALLGIAAGTIAVGKVIDNSQQDTATSTKLSQQNIPSKGFFIDIISDENGVSVHRLQNVLWTIVVGIIYITYVCIHDKTKSALPDSTLINATMLGLMGVSSAAYLGVKATENK